MKKLLLFQLCVITIFFLKNTSASPCLYNPGFEDGPAWSTDAFPDRWEKLEGGGMANWETERTTSGDVPVTQTPPAFEGDKYIALGGNTHIEWVVWRQWLPVGFGDVITFNAMALSGLPVDGTEVSLNIGFYYYEGRDGGYYVGLLENRQYITPPVWDGNSVPPWTLYSITSDPAPSGTEIVFVALVYLNQEASPEYIYFDNIEIDSCDPRILGDFNSDNKVDLQDVAVLSNEWNDSFEIVTGYEEVYFPWNVCDIAVPQDGEINLDDLIVFSRYWLEGAVLSEPGLDYQIEKCDLGGMSLAAAGLDDLRFTVTVEGNNILFEDMMVANCCPDELWLEMTVDGNIITIYERELTTYPCKCICDYPISAAFGPFNPGTYTIEVYEDFGGFIDTTTVVID